MNPGWAAWTAFCVFVLAMLLVDLFGFHRTSHSISIREAAAWSVVWVTLALGFAVVVLVWGGAHAAGEYLAGYVIEKSLSVDNLFMFAVIFSHFAVPPAYQHRVLFVGIFGALVFRAAFIAGGAALLNQFHFMAYVFGAFLLVTGVKLARRRHAEPDLEANRALRLLRRVVPMPPGYRGTRLFVRSADPGAPSAGASLGVVRERGGWLATPMLAVLVAIEATDLVFAVDSIPAVFAVTRDPFLAFTSNAFAILGLRALYFLLAGVIARFTHLKTALALILVFVGAKMLVGGVYEVPVWASLAVIALILGGAAALSRTTEL